MTADEMTDSNETLAGQGKRDNRRSLDHLADLQDGKDGFTMIPDRLMQLWHDNKLPDAKFKIICHMLRHATTFKIKTQYLRNRISPKTLKKYLPEIIQDGYVRLEKAKSKCGSVENIYHTNPLGDWIIYKEAIPTIVPKGTPAKLTHVPNGTVPNGTVPNGTPLTKPSETIPSETKLNNNGGPECQGSGREAEGLESVQASKPSVSKTKLQEHPTYQQLMADKAKRFESENDENQKLMALKSELGVVASKLDPNPPASRKSIFDRWFRYFKTPTERFPYDEIYRVVDAAIAKGKVDQIETILKTEHREGKPTVAAHCRNYKILTAEYVTMIIEHGCRDIKIVEPDPEPEQPKMTPEGIKRFSRKFEEHKRKLGYTNKFKSIE